LDGAVSRRGVAQFRLIPYVTREGKELERMALEEDNTQAPDGGEQDLDEEELSDEGY
jgi:hypothetical protein